MLAAFASSVGVMVSMPAILHFAKSEIKPNLCNLRRALSEPLLHNATMTRERLTNHLRAWREFRRMTQEELAEKVGTTGAVISLIESGARGLSDKWLRKLAPALNTTAGHLLDHDPNDLPTDIIDIWSHIAERDKPTALRVLQSFRTGTDD